MLKSVAPQFLFNSPECVIFPKNYNLIQARSLYCIGSNIIHTLIFLNNISFYIILLKHKETIWSSYYFLKQKTKGIMQLYYSTWKDHYQGHIL